MKVLWMSDSPTVATGFGNVARYVCGGLADRGHDVSILHWATKGEPTPWQNCTLYPVTHWSNCVRSLSGSDADQLLNYLRRLHPDLLVPVGDLWWFTYITNPVI